MDSTPLYKLLRQTLLFLLYSFLISKSAGAQTKIYPQPTAFHYTIDDGLPGNNIYKIIQDKKGYLWIATNEGVARYNGKKFTVFPIADGIPLNDVYNLSEDSKGRIWMCSLSSVFYYTDNKIHNLAENVKNLTLNSFHWDIQQDSCGNIILAGNTMAYFFDTELNYTGTIFGEILPNLSVSKECKSLSIIDNNYILPSHLNNEIKIKIPFCPIRCLGNKLDNTLCYDLDGDVFPLVNPSAIFNIPALFHRPQGSFVNMLKLTNDEWYISLTEGNVRARWDGCEFTDVEWIVVGKKIITVFDDSFGNLWMGTQEEGLLKIPNENALNFSVKNSLENYTITCIAEDEENNILLGTNNGQIIKLFPDNHIQVFSIDISQRPILDIKVINGQLICHNDRILYHLDSKNLSAHKSFQCSTLKMMYQSQNGKTWLGSIGLFEQDDSGFQFLPSTFSKRYYALYETDDSLWCGTEKGVFIYSKEKDFLYPYDTIPVLKNVMIRSIQPDPFTNTLWFGTFGNGIVAVNGHQYNQFFPQTNCRKLVVDTIHKCVIAATDKGLAFIDNIGDPAHSNTFILNESDGIGSKRISNFFIDHLSRIWITTPKGLTVIPYPELKKNMIPGIIDITGVRIKNADTTILADYNLSYWKNDIKIFFNAISFNDYPNFNYKLSGRNESWHTTSDEVLEFYDLPPGAYSLWLHSAADSIIPEKPILNFTINKPFWKTYWFILLLLSTLISALFIIISARIRFLRRRNYWAQLAINGLQAQMNNHFLFNTLYAIQNYILKGDRMVAFDYLAKMGTLIRNTLAHATKEHISLGEELETLHHYLDLEKLRSQNSFSANISLENISSEDKEMIMIAPFFIQPYVENAVKWGMSSISQNGRIEIHITKTPGKKIVCQIKDNGLGRKKVQQLKNSEQNNQSFSGDINAKRLALLSKLGNSSISIEISDITTGDEVAGTMVEIILPYVLRSR